MSVMTLALEMQALTMQPLRDVEDDGDSIAVSNTTRTALFGRR
jgi:hypothetical protein